MESAVTEVLKDNAETSVEKNALQVATHQQINFGVLVINVWSRFS